MEVISRKEISNKQAVHLLKKIAKDEFIEENDPELAKNINIVSSELQAYYTYIGVDSSMAPKEEKVEVKEEEAAAPAEEAPAVEAPKKHRRKHHSTPQE